MTTQASTPDKNSLALFEPTGIVESLVGERENEMPVIEQLDIRDIESGEAYYALADSERGGRCVLSGMFIAA